MRKLALLAAAAALPVIAPSALAQYAGDYNWTGSYVGVNLGQGRNAEFDLDAALEIDAGSAFFPGALAGGTFPTMRTFDGDGWVGGIQAGANWQTGMFVLGGEVDVQLSDISSNTSIPNAPGGAADNPDGFTDLNFEVDYFATARLRGGVAFDRFLIYATGGGAYGRVDFDRNYRVGAAEITDSESSNQFGWTYGAGVEWGVTDFWTLRAEYSRVDLGSSNFDTSYDDGTIGRATIDTQFDVIRAGANFRF
ncbi:outer membrane protein [Glycocaulis sp.]|uniref:outer membrane protein n=1 Tax=Glycocaulis sp. TaxID=1969725 RepID=UPI003D229D45